MHAWTRHSLARAHLNSSVALRRPLLHFHLHLHRFHFQYAYLMSPDGHDVELQSGAQRRHTSKLRGYPSFADFIASDSDAAVFRTYRSLSARNLLYLQSELHELGAKLHDLDNEDVKSSSFEAEGAAQLWRHYNSELNPRAVEHRKLQKDIREKLKEYRKSSETKTPR